MLLRFNDLTTIDCKTFNYNNSTKQITLTFEYKELKDMLEASYGLYQAFSDTELTRTLCLVNSVGNILGEVYTNFGEPQVFTATPKKAGDMHITTVILTKKQTYEDRINEIESNMQSLDKTIENIESQLHPVLDIDGMTLEEYQEYKIKEIQDYYTTCIENGVDVDLGDRTEHFSLTTTDQLNITKLAQTAMKFGVGVPYHSDKSSCKMYTPVEMNTISIMADAYVLQMCTIINGYNVWVRRCTTKNDVSMIQYNTPFPDDIQSNVNTIFANLEVTIQGFKDSLVPHTVLDAELNTDSDVGEVE